MGDVATAVAQQDEAAGRARTLRDSIKRMESQFALALPRHVTVDRFVRAALTALGTVRHLPECTEQSVLAGLTQAAQLGLEVSDVRGQCYLVPRRNRRNGNRWEATFQLGYRGMIDLAARAGITVDVDTVYAHDTFDFERGTNARLYHRPTLDDPGDAIAYYAVAHFADSRRPQFVIRGRKAIEIHRDRFASQRDGDDVAGPWVEHFDAMARKTVIRMLLNTLPTSAELREAVTADTRAEEQPIPATYGPMPDPLGAIDTTTSDDRTIDTTTGEITNKDAPSKSKRRTRKTAPEPPPAPPTPPGGSGDEAADPGDQADAAWVEAATAGSSPADPEPHDTEEPTT